MNFIQKIFNEFFLNKEDSDLIWYRKELQKFIRNYDPVGSGCAYQTVLKELDGTYYGGSVYYSYNENYCDIVSCIKFTRYKVSKSFDGQTWVRNVFPSYSYLFDTK